MDEQTKTAFASAADTSKQLITLATGVIALEMTFIKDVIATPGLLARSALALSWIMFLLSVVAGVWMLLAITGSLGGSQTLTPQTISNDNIRIPAMIQITLFVFALVFSVAFGVLGVY